MWVGQEAAVEHDVDVERQAVLVAEREHVDLHATARIPGGEVAVESLPQLVDVQVAGVDDDVGFGPDRLEQPSLTLDGVGQTLTRPHEWVATPAALVTADEGVGGSIEVQHAHRHTQAAERGERRSHLGVVPAGPQHQGDPTRRRAGTCASSTTLGISSGGRLSITNQPRSSSPQQPGCAPRPTAR